MNTDYFSAQADRYVAFRPHYPDALFDALCRELPAAALAWDCATGNGQAAVMLGRRVARVIGSDRSAAQLRHAIAQAHVHYVQACAEAMPLRAHSVDLITIAQALHWFDFARFHAEAARVLKPGGIIAAWTYSFLSVIPQLGGDIERVLRRFYHDVVGPHWPAERRWVDEGYRTIPFPWPAIDIGAFTIDVAWNLASVVGYVSSWSATQRYITATGTDPLPMLARELAEAWGTPETTRRLQWPLSIRAGRMPAPRH
jgi:SAM-dependent methyltransferase